MKSKITEHEDSTLVLENKKDTNPDSLRPSSYLGKRKIAQISPKNIIYKNKKHHHTSGKLSYIYSALWNKLPF